jgi:hypothetical protein
MYVPYNFFDIEIYAQRKKGKGYLFKRPLFYPLDIGHFSFVFFVFLIFFDVFGTREEKLNNSDQNKKKNKSIYNNNRTFYSQAS